MLITDLAGFIICSIAIFFAGQKLSYYADNIAKVTKLGRAWIGLILIASITSLPELVVGISSTTVVKSADLAVGNILGSCGFNLGLLALMDAFVPKHKSILSLASQNHVVAAGMGIILIALAGVGLYLPDDIVLIPGIGLMSISFILVYFFSVWLIHRFDARTRREDNHQPGDDITILDRKAQMLYFGLFALVIIAAAVFLPYFTNNIAESLALNKTFAGTFLLAITTSLPEIAVSIAAVRMGAIDICVGNLLGSNLFNIFILAINSVFYTGHLLKDASDVNLISILATIIMFAIAIIGLSFRIEAKRYLLAWDAILIFLVYFLNIVLISQLGS